MIPRKRHQDRVTGLLGRGPVTAIVGARQVGKTTLARLIADEWSDDVHFFDLEHPRDAARLEDPMLVLEPLRGLAVLDEVQRIPNLFTTLRVLADRPGLPCRFLVLGSASPDLLRQSSETLAGRIAYHELDGLALDEVGVTRARQLWLRGGFPRALLAGSDQESGDWRRDFIATFVERDLPQLGVSMSAVTARRFWTMLAHYHGQLLNSSELAGAFGVSDKTVRAYLDALTSTFVVRLHRPWHQNIRKRQVKSPKVYLRDSGLLHTLLGLEKMEDLEGHPKVGSSWEGFALDAITRVVGARPDQCYFWATHGGAELDLLIVAGGRRIGFEVKRTTAPRRTRSMTIALADLELESLDVVHPGDQTYPLGERIRAVGITRLLDDVAPLA